MIYVCSSGVLMDSFDRIIVSRNYTISSFTASFLERCMRINESVTECRLEAKLFQKVIKKGGN